MNSRSFVLSSLLTLSLVFQAGMGFCAEAPKPSPAAARSPASPTPTATPAESPQLKEFREKLAAAQAELNQLAGMAVEPTPVTGEALGSTANEDSQESREQLSRIVRVYNRAIVSLGNLASEEARSADLAKEETAWKRTGTNGNTSLPFPSPAPYPIRMVDELRESLQSVTQYSQTVAFTIALLNNSISDNALSLEPLEAQLRQLYEKIEKAAKDPSAAQLTQQKEKLQLSIRASKAVREMLGVELKLWQARQSNLKRQADLLTSQIAAAAPLVKFTQAELDKIVAGLSAQARQLEKEHQKVVAENQPAQKALAEARQNLTQAEQTVAASGTTSADSTARLSQLKEILEVRRVQAETVGIREELLQQLQQQNRLETTAWQTRFTAFSSDPAKAGEARKKLPSYSDRFQVLAAYYKEQDDLNSRQLSDLDDYTRNSTTATPSSLKCAQERLESLRLREDYYKRVLQSLEKSVRQAQRWAEELKSSEESEKDPKKRMAGWFTSLGGFVGRFWNYEFYKVADPSFPDGLRPITVEKVITAFGILFIGHFICRLLARQMQKFLTRRIHMESNMADIIRGWMMFFLTLGLVMIAMDWVKIPLTAFAFLGGALAIGVGFGTQNLLKNFISGIMLLVEQPLRLGDLIEVGSSRGKVVNIGIRSSIIRNADGIETLIPNSSFLESNVTNWTYSNPQVRFRIRVGVAYNTSSREVCDILERVVDSHGKVNKSPKPQVLLEEFTEKGMVFSLYYWLEPLKLDAAAVSSDLRFMIERQLAEAGIQLT